MILGLSGRKKWPFRVRWNGRNLGRHRYSAPLALAGEAYRVGDKVDEASTG